ncbi:MAG: CsbD family protein [Myxococcota bacterium]|nr:CsbD family protein [Myxococcota bacterium]
MGAIVDKIKGKLKKAEGQATGDKLRTAQGTATEKKGDLKGAVSRVARKAKAGVRKVQRKSSSARRTP